MQRLAVAVLLALAPACSCLQPVGECPPDCTDSGNPLDGGLHDAGSDDSGTPLDAGGHDAGTFDAGLADAGFDAGVVDAGPARQWLDVTPAGPAPTGSYSLAAAYDSVHDKVLLFGGESDNPSITFDTWEWDPANRTWTQLAATGPQYLYPSMIYDVQRDRFVLAAQDFADGRVDLSTWDRATSNWVHLDAMGDAPPYRQFTALAYASNGNALLFGGSTGDPSGTNLSTPWLFDGQQWQQPSSAHLPPPRVLTVLASDGATGQVWLYAGDMSDLWSWNGSDWARLDDGSAGAPDPEGPAIAYDAHAQRLVAWGDCSTPNSRVWEWDGTKWANFSLSPSPAARCYGALVYDSKRSEMLAYGGQIFDPSCSCAKTYHDTWIYKLR